MKRVTLTPGLTLDSKGFELARAALEKFAPLRAALFTYEQYVDFPNWSLIPDPNHPEWPFFKAEFKVPAAPGERAHAKTCKLNYWLHADRRATGQPIPHSHPWKEFRGHVLRGGYEEDRYEVSQAHLLRESPREAHDLGVVSVTQGVIHHAGNANRIPVSTFHEVTKILEKGTLTFMDCDEGVQEGWGYLDPDTGLYLPNKKSPIDTVFAEMKRERNKHRLKR